MLLEFRRVLFLSFQTQWTVGLCDKVGLSMQGLLLCSCLWSLAAVIQWRKTVNYSLSCSALPVLSSGDDLWRRCIGVLEFFEYVLNNPQSSSHKAKKQAPYVSQWEKKESYHKALIVRIPCPLSTHKQADL